MFLYKNNDYIYNWLAKLKENQVNSDVLLLIFKGYFQHYQNIDTKLNKIIEKITKELTMQEMSNYDILRIENIASLKVNTNTILIGYEVMDRKFLQDIDFQILCFYCKNYNKETILPIVTTKTVQNKHIDESLCIIKKRSPIEILSNYKAYQIEDYLYSYFQQKLSPYDNKITIFYPNIFKIWIRGDIKILSKEKILTARLAIIIYKVSTLNFNVSDKKIGLFYKNVFGTKSKSKRLKIYNNETYKVYCIGKWLESNI